MSIFLRQQILRWVREYFQSFRFWYTAFEVNTFEMWNEAMDGEKGNKTIKTDRVEVLRLSFPSNSNASEFYYL